MGNATAIDTASITKRNQTINSKHMLNCFDWPSDDSVRLLAPVACALDPESAFWPHLLGVFCYATDCCVYCCITGPGDFAHPSMEKRFSTRALGNDANCSWSSSAIHPLAPNEQVKVEHDPRSFITNVCLTPNRTLLAT